MITRRLRWEAGGVFAALLVGLFLVGPGASGQDKKDKDKLELDKIPKVVMDALKAKFPKAEIQKWTKEKEGDDVVYDIEFKENGRACEADIKEDGTYINYEKAIAAKDLPAAVTKAIESKFPKATLKEIMEETEVKGKDEKLSAFEVVLVTSEKKTVEVRLSPDGKVLEEEVLGEKKEEPAKAKDLDKIPKKVMDALKAKFPKAEIHKWTKEKEGDDVVYDIEFKEGGRACEADIKEDGTYINYEKAIAAKDLPAAVTKAIESKFPKATLKEIMEETEVKGKDEKLSAYEVVLVTADMKTVEVRLSPDGNILEEEVLGGKQ